MISLGQQIMDAQNELVLFVRSYNCEKKEDEIKK